MTVPTIDPNLRKNLPGLIKMAVIWGPIGVGVIHQILMALGITSRIYVFVKPPEYIDPQASVAYQWWLVLLIISGLIGLLIYLNRLRNLPRRLAIPFYVYVLYLLILVRPLAE